MIDTMKKATEAMFASGTEPVDITSDLYFHMMEILPPKDFWHDSFTTGEGGELYLFKRSLHLNTVEPLIEHHIVNDIHFTMSRKRYDKEFSVVNVFSTIDGSDYDNPNRKFSSAQEFVEWLPVLLCA